MAVTGVVTLSPNAVVPGQSCNATLTVTNSGGTAVTMATVQPYVTTASGSGAACNLGQINFGPNQNNVVLVSSGTLAVVYPIEFFAPQPGSGYVGNPSTESYTCGCLFSTSDGSQVTATTASITVSAPTH